MAWAFRRQPATRPTERRRIQTDSLCRLNERKSARGRCDLGALVALAPATGAVQFLYPRSSWTTCHFVCHISENTVQNNQSEIFYLSLIIWATSSELRSALICSLFWVGLVQMVLWQCGSEHPFTTGSGPWNVSDPGPTIGKGGGQRNVDFGSEPRILQSGNDIRTKVTVQAPISRDVIVRLPNQFEKCHCYFATAKRYQWLLSPKALVCHLEFCTTWSLRLKWHISTWCRIALTYIASRTIHLFLESILKRCTFLKIFPQVLWCPVCGQVL